MIVGTGSNCTAHAIELSKKAQDMGADALLVVTPYYNKCSQEGLYRHYAAIADSVGIPVIAYNVPGRTGVNMQPATLARLAEAGKVAAMKEASGNISQITEMIRLCGDAIDFSADGVCRRRICGKQGGVRGGYPGDGASSKGGA